MRFAGGGETLWARFAQPEGNAPIASVLLVQGWTGSIQNYEIALGRELARNGFATMAFDLPGHGRSSGSRDDLPCLSFVEATAAAYDVLADKAPETDIFVVGMSFGGYLVSRLLQHRPVAGAALLVPANYPDGDDRTMTAVTLTPEAQQWRGQTLPSGSTAAMRALSTYVRPLLVLQASRDDLIPPQTVDNLIRDVPVHQVSRFMIQDAPHLLYTDRRALAATNDVLMTWLRERSGVLRPVPAS
ncbi:hypothetical protein GCM10027456_76720 [Kineosporia babensis]